MLSREPISLGGRCKAPGAKSDRIARDSGQCPRHYGPSSCWRPSFERTAGDEEMRMMPTPAGSARQLFARQERPGSEKPLGKGNRLNRPADCAMADDGLMTDGAEVLISALFPAVEPPAPQRPGLEQSFAAAFDSSNSFANKSSALQKSTR